MSLMAAIHCSGAQRVNCNTLSPDPKIAKRVCMLCLNFRKTHSFMLFQFFKLRSCTTVFPCYDELMPTDPAQRLMELAAFINDEAGAWDSTTGRWNNPQAIAIAPHDLWQMELLIQALRTLGLPDPHIYPTMEGGVTAEWDWNNWSVSVDTGSHGMRAHTLWIANSADVSQTPPSVQEHEEVLPCVSVEELTYALGAFWAKMTTAPSFVNSHGLHRSSPC